MDQSSRKFSRIVVSVSLLRMGPAMAGNLCESDDALSSCLSPKAKWLQIEPSNGESHYVAESIRYFLTMKSDQSQSATIAKDSTQTVTEFLRPLEKGEWNPVNKWFQKSTIHPHYSPLSVRYEFPPWLLTTGYGEITMKNVDEALRQYPTDYKSIECIDRPVQPFGRCHVVFLYGTDDEKTPQDDRTECPIYEEFTFNDQGAITFIEAWSDHPGYLPMAIDDFWAEAADVKRMSTSVPGLGNAKGLMDPKSEAMKEAALVFDANYQSEFWDASQHPMGPFASMLHDIQGKFQGVQLPAGGLFSIWPGWIQRAIAHQNVLDGCQPSHARPQK